MCVICVCVVFSKAVQCVLPTPNQRKQDNKTHHLGAVPLVRWPHRHCTGTYKHFGGSADRPIVRFGDVCLLGTFYRLGGRIGLLPWYFEHKKIYTVYIYIYNSFIIYNVPPYKRNIRIISRDFTVTKKKLSSQNYKKKIIFFFLKPRSDFCCDQLLKKKNTPRSFCLFRKRAEYIYIHVYIPVCIYPAYLYIYITSQKQSNNKNYFPSSD